MNSEMEQLIEIALLLDVREIRVSNGEINTGLIGARNLLDNVYEIHPDSGTVLKIPFREFDALLLGRFLSRIVGVNRAIFLKLLKGLDDRSLDHGIQYFPLQPLDEKGVHRLVLQLMVDREEMPPYIRWYVITNQMAQFYENDKLLNQRYGRITNG